MARRRRRTGRIAGAAVALQILSACAASPPPAPTASATPPAPPPSAATASATPAPPPINDDPARLLGLAASDLTALLGDPVRVRRDGTAEIRQFGDASRCQIDTFLYPDAGVPRVTHVEMRHGIDRLDEAASRACLRRMIRENATS